MTRGWQLARDADPEVRAWGEECVVHHALSNDTFRLTREAGQLLEQLVQRGDEAPPGTAEDSSDCAVEAILEALAELSLVERC